MYVTPDHLLGDRCVGPRELPRDMIDREKVLAILRKRFPGASADQLAAAANAIVGLSDEWREVDDFGAELEHHLEGCSCGDADWFGHRFAQGRRFKLFEHVDDG